MIVDPIIAGSLTVIGGLSATVFMQRTPEARRKTWEVRQAEETLGPPKLHTGFLRIMNPFERIRYFHRTEKLGHEILLVAGRNAVNNIATRQNIEEHGSESDEYQKEIPS